MNPYLSHQGSSSHPDHPQPRLHTNSANNNTTSSSTSSSGKKKHHSQRNKAQSSKGGNPCGNIAGEGNTSQLHPKNFYRIHPVNFYTYAVNYPTLLGPHIDGITVDPTHQRCVINWKSPAATRALSTVMLRHDFHLDVDFLPTSLVPPLPNRLNYLCWLSDLHESNVSIVGTEAKQLTVLDIGTGSNLIYPLLGAQYFQFKFVGTDIHPVSIQHAQQLIQRNQSQLKNEIHVVQVPSSAAMQHFLVQHYLPLLYPANKRQQQPSSQSKPSHDTMAMSTNAEDVVDIEEADRIQTSQCSTMDSDVEEEEEDNDEEDGSSQSASQQPHLTGKLLDMVHAHLLSCADAHRHQHAQQPPPSPGNVIVSSKRSNVENHDVIASRGPLRTAFANMEDTCKYRLLDCEYAWLNRPSSSSLSSSYNAESQEDCADSTFSPKRVKRSTFLQSTSSSQHGVPPPPSSVPVEQPLQKWRPLLFACMTNPPFYDVGEEVQVNEDTVCTGTDFEMKTLGGEVAFIASMIVDSCILRESVMWYTAMVGKKSSLKVLKKMLLREGVPHNHIFTSLFAQGVTHRWGLAWTFVPEAAALYAAFEVLGRASSSSTSGNSNTSSNANSSTINSNTTDYLSAAAGKATTAMTADADKFEFQVSFEQYLSTSLVEETKDMFVYLQSRNLSINMQSTVALTALVPIIATRMNLVCSKLEEAYTAVNIKAHIADVSYITNQGTFGNTAANGALRVEIIHNALSVHDPEALSVIFHVHYEDQQVRRQLATLEVFIKIARMPPHGYIQLFGKVHLVASQCSAGLANRLQCRTFELMGSEFVRNSRKWRRLFNPKAT